MLSYTPPAYQSYEFYNSEIFAEACRVASELAPQFSNQTIVPHIRAVRNHTGCSLIVAKKAVDYTNDGLDWRNLPGAKRYTFENEAGSFAATFIKILIEGSVTGKVDVVITDGVVFSIITSRQEQIAQLVQVLQRAGFFCRPNVSYRVSGGVVTIKF